MRVEAPEKNGDTCGHKGQEASSLQGLTRRVKLRFNGQGGCVIACFQALTPAPATGFRPETAPSDPQVGPDPAIAWIMKVNQRELLS